MLPAPYSCPEQMISSSTCTVCASTQVYVDLKEVAAGSLEEDWDILPPKVR